MSDGTWFVLVILLLVAVGFGVWGYLRHRYVKSLEAKGWRFISSPPIGIIYGLNVPPFGVGFNRKVDDQILGTARDGTPFTAFEYQCTGWRSPGYVVTMPLPKSLPPAAISPAGPPILADVGPFIEEGMVRVSTPEYEYARELAAAAGPRLRSRFRISIDHDTIVLANAPKEADPLEAAIEELAAVRAGILASPASRRTGPPPPPALSFSGHPDWVYLPRDDSYLGQLNHSGGGFAHEAHDVIYSLNAGIPFVRLRHTWKTRHTRRDSNGNTRTEIRNHEEILCEFRTTFPFHDFSINWGMFGRSQKFEWEEFNRRFTVRTPNPRFGSDVVHQRQMEYLMRSNAPKFQIANGAIRVGDGGRWLPDDIERASHFLHGFFGHVPNFVWQQLGAWPRPIPEIEAGS